MSNAGSNNPNVKVSDRGIELVTQRAYTSMLTVENYLKWYDLFVLHPNGKVETVSWENETLRDGWRDHCIEPRAFHLLTKELGLSYDNETMAAVIKMFVVNYLDWDWTNLSEYLPREEDRFEMQLNRGWSMN
jgi:hypothetical protein